MSDIIFVRTFHSPEQEFGWLHKFAYVEISNGLCWLSAVTRQNGYKTEIIDALALRLSNDELVDVIINKKPKYIGITACTPDIYDAADLSYKLKKVRPEITIIVGGAHITAAPKETMERFPSFDIGVVGEGENTLVDLLDSLEEKNSKSLSEIDGIIYRNKEKTLLTNPRVFIKDLDSLPLPAWDMLPDLKEHYLPPAWTMHGGRTATIITSRGCPFKCIYCDRKVFGNRVRFHSPEYVLVMIKTMHFQHGISHFRISDDNFLAHKKRLKRICNLIEKEKLEITWSCLARVDIMDPETLSLMKAAGCWSIAFGVETGSQKIHDIEKKNVTLEQIEKAVKITRKAGIKTIGFNIIGHPLETIDTIKQTIKFNKKIKIDDFKTQFMTPFPGTELYQYAERYGTFDRDWKKMSVFTEPVFIPHGLTKEDLVIWNKNGFWSFYLQPRIIFSYFIKIRSIKELIIIATGGITLIAWKAKELLNSKRR